MSKQAREGSALQWVAVLVPALAAFPAAYFVGRSTYFYLVLGWFESHVLFWPWLGVIVAVVAGLVVEGLGTVSLFLWSSFRRWNRVKAVRYDEKARKKVLKRGYDFAPEGLALVALGGYVIAVVVLLVLLEWMPDAARFAPVMFPVLTVVGGLCWSLYDQHRDRLAYHGISWNWVAQRRGTDEPERQGTVKAKPQPKQVEPKPTLTELEQAIVDAYRAGAGTYEQVAAIVDKSKTTVGGRVGLLIQKGVLERTLDGVIVRSDNGNPN